MINDQSNYLRMYWLRIIIIIFLLLLQIRYLARHVIDISLRAQALGGVTPPPPSQLLFYP